MAYRIEVTPAAARAITRADHQPHDRICGGIALLGQDPRPPDAKALQGRPGFHVRIGDYRIVYTIQDDVLHMVVITLGATSTGDSRSQPCR